MRMVFFVCLLACAGCAAPSFPPTPTVLDSFVMYSNGHSSAQLSARGANSDWFRVSPVVAARPVSP